MADSLKLTDIAAELQGVATDGKDHIFEEVYGLGENEADAENGIVAMADYAAELDTPDKVVLTKIYASGALQPGGIKVASGKVFNPVNDSLVVKPRVAQVEPIALNFLLTQEKLEILKKSYLSGVRKNSIANDVLPFADYIFNSIISEAKEELRAAYFQSIHNAEGTTHLAIFDGWRKQVLDAIISGDIPSGNVTETAVISSTNAVAEFDKIVEDVPTNMLGKVVCLIPRKLKKMYENDFLTRYGSASFNTGVKKTVISGTSIPFLVEPGLDGFTRPIITTRKNLVRLYDSASSKTDLTIDYDKRERNIAIVMDAQAGCGFADGSHVWTNFTV